MKKLVIIGVVVLLASCLTTKIVDLKENPTKYAGSVVKVTGVVTKVINIPLTEYLIYELTDETGDIIVFTSNEKRKGESIRIDAKVVAYSSGDDKNSSIEIVNALKDFMISKNLASEEKATKLSKSISKVVIAALDRLELTYFLIESNNE